MTPRDRIRQGQPVAADGLAADGVARLDFGYRAGLRRRYRNDFTRCDVLQALEAFGHRWRIVRGTKPVAADAGILHVNTTRLADAYLALASPYRLSLNFKAADISKRHVSGASLAEGDRAEGDLAVGDSWAGSVIIKSDLNSFGKPEALLNQMAQRRGRVCLIPA